MRRRFIVLSILTSIFASALFLVNHYQKRASLVYFINQQYAISIDDLNEKNGRLVSYLNAEVRKRGISNSSTLRETRLIREKTHELLNVIKAPITNTQPIRTHFKSYIDDLDALGLDDEKARIYQSKIDRVLNDYHQWYYFGIDKITNPSIQSRLSLTLLQIENDALKRLGPGIRMKMVYQVY